MNLEPGDLFTAEIKSVLPNGLATVEYDNTLINIGYVACDKGRQVQLRYLGEREELGNHVGFALCLTEEILAPNHSKWIRGIRDHLIPDEPPDIGEVSYAEIDEIDERGLGIAELGGERIQLGPVRAEVGSLVRIVGIGNQCAEVRTESARGENYMTRLNILAGRHDQLSVSEGDEITTTISDIDDDALIGYVGDVPIRFPAGSAEIAQKVDGRITGFARDMVLGEVIKTYDEPGRIEHASHWARMQWLKEAGLGQDPFRTFASGFTGAPEEALPERDDQIRDVLIAEAIRLGLRDKTSRSDEEYPQTHITGLRHWVVHKLAAILGDPAEDNDGDWFREVMSERKGPTVTFYGDLLQLAGGYYAPTPTRAIMTTETEAVLISGEPSQAFLDAGFDLQYRGITRIITDTSEDELAGNGIPRQSQRAYVGTDDKDLLTGEDLIEFIKTQNQEEWEPETDWEPYTGQQYGFVQDGEPLVVPTDEGQVSFWRIPVEYGSDAYELKVESAQGSSPAMIDVPTKYRKQVCLILDALSGLPQRVELNGDDDAVVVNCDFAPPRPQMRWLHAIGAQWIDSPTHQLQWRISPDSVDSVVDVFEKLPVTVTNNVKGDS